MTQQTPLARFARCPMNRTAYGDFGLAAVACFLDRTEQANPEWRHIWTEVRRRCSQVGPKTAAQLQYRTLTDHGPGHYVAVLGLCWKMVIEWHLADWDAKVIEPLTDQDAFVLILSALLHDVRMGEGYLRQSHTELPVNVLMNQYKITSQRLAERIADVCPLHGSKAQPSMQDLLDSGRPDRQKTAALGAVLRIADCLDCTYERVGCRVDGLPRLYRGVFREQNGHPNKCDLDEDLWQAQILEVMIDGTAIRIIADQTHRYTWRLEDGRTSPQLNRKIEDKIATKEIKPCLPALQSIGVTDPELVLHMHSATVLVPLKIKPCRGIKLPRPDSYDEMARCFDSDYTRLVALSFMERSFWLRQDAREGTLRAAYCDIEDTVRSLCTINGIAVPRRLGSVMAGFTMDHAKHASIIWPEPGRKPAVYCMRREYLPGVLLLAQDCGWRLPETFVSAKDLEVIRPWPEPPCYGVAKKMTLAALSAALRASSSALTLASFLAPGVRRLDGTLRGSERAQSATDIGRNGGALAAHNGLDKEAAAFKNSLKGVLSAFAHMRDENDAPILFQGRVVLKPKQHMYHLSESMMDPVQRLVESRGWRLPPGWSPVPLTPSSI